MFFRWGIYFSGLLSLGNHPPPHGRLPTDAIVLCLNDTYFSSAAHLKDNVTGTFKPRYLHIGKADECQAVGSYDTDLLSRLQYIQRVLKKQEEVNLRHKNHLMSRGVVDVGDAKSLLPAKKENRTKYASMFSTQVIDYLVKFMLFAFYNLHSFSLTNLICIKCSTFNFIQSKSAPTRLRESELQAQIERARVRVELLAFEKVRLQLEIDEINTTRKSINAKVRASSCLDLILKNF